MKVIYMHGCRNTNPNFTDRHMPGTPRSWDLLADLNGALINSNTVVDYPRLLPETFVNVGGMQIREEPKPLPRVRRIYRVAHLLANLGWVDLDLGSSLGCGPLLWLPTAQAGWWNIPNLSQPNPVRQEMGHPVL